MTTPLVKMLTHRGPVQAVAVDHTGQYMATSGLDGQLKVWDVRTYKLLQEYYTPTPAGALSISQLGLLAVGWGPHISVSFFFFFVFDKRGVTKKMVVKMRKRNTNPSLTHSKLSNRYGKMRSRPSRTRLI